MKKIGKVLFFSFLTLISVQTFAQKIGIQGGINLANMLVEDDEATYSEDFTMNLGYNAGVTFELGLGKLLSLEVGAMADTKGFKWELDGGTMKANVLYADVPVLLKVGPQLGPLKVFGAAGPYIGYGITGKLIAIPDEGSKETEDIEFGDTQDDYLKRLDYGAKFGVGAEVMGITIGAYYSLGLANISPVTEGGAKINHKVISVSLGYKLGL